MKKSKIVTIGLLALSIASCHHKRKDSKYQDWNDYQSNGNYYINDGTGYYHGGVSPIWIYWAYTLGRNNSLMYEPGYVYRSYGRYGGYHTTEFGSRSSISRSSVSRGGFGTSAHHVSA